MKSKTPSKPKSSAAAVAAPVQVVTHDAPPAAPRKRLVRSNARLADKIEERVGDGALSPAYSSAWIVNAFDEVAGDERLSNIASVADKVERMAEAIRAGDLGDIEELLIAQASSLNVIFKTYAVRAAAESENVQRSDQLLQLALKAQACSRATLATLIDLKFPRTTVIARQANLASGHQQVVNGGTPGTAHSEGSDR